MWGFGNKTRDIITLFHKSSSQSSIRVQTLLKQLSAQASETATVDQASDHSAQNKLQRSEFDLEVVETDPTPDQLRTILESNSDKVGQLVPGAKSVDEALKQIRNFHRPTIVDWANGAATTGESESEIMKLLNAGKK